MVAGEMSGGAVAAGQSSDHRSPPPLVAIVPSLECAPPVRLLRPRTNHARKTFIAGCGSVVFWAAIGGSLFAPLDGRLPPVQNVLVRLRTVGRDTYKVGRTSPPPIESSSQARLDSHPSPLAYSPPPRRTSEIHHAVPLPPRRHVRRPRGHRRPRCRCRSLEDSFHLLRESLCSAAVQPAEG